MRHVSAVCLVLLLAAVTLGEILLVGQMTSANATATLSNGRAQGVASGSSSDETLVRPAR